MTPAEFEKAAAAVSAYRDLDQKISNVDKMIAELKATGDRETLKIGTNQYHLLEFPEPVKRLAIQNVCSSLEWYRDQLAEKQRTVEIDPPGASSSSDDDVPF